MFFSVVFNFNVSYFKNLWSKKEGDKIIKYFSTKNINVISFLISIIIFLGINIFIHNLNSNCGKDTNKSNCEDVSFQNNINNNNIEIIESHTEDLNWYIEIPAIGLKAPIQETVSMKVLNNYVGHFEETTKKEGNIGLAGHNRGYAKNYFENLDKLKKGDEIKYKYHEFESKYYVEIIEIIKSTNWSYLNNFKENKITLITCIENKPDYRLCIQAIQK